jgi:ornithine carbamoyltransferase
MAKKHTLDTPARPRPAYVMPAPNDDMGAYGWDLKNIREADPKSSDKKDPDKGPELFRAPQENMQTMRRYGHDAQFICPKYLQILLDKSEELRKAVNKAAENRYRSSDIDDIQAAVNKVFNDVVLPDIVTNFERASRAIAQFYAARMAHIKKFGSENG